MTEARLVIAGGPDAGREFAVTGAVILGRDTSAGIVVDDEEVSRRHTSVELAGDSVRVEDLGSTNGTFLNGERIEGSRELKNGDKVRLGQTVFEVQMEQPEGATKIASVIPDEGPQVTKPGTTMPEGAPPPVADVQATQPPTPAPPPPPSAEPVAPGAQVTDVRQVPPDPGVQVTDVRQVPSDLPPPPGGAPGPPPPAPGGPQSPAQGGPPPVAAPQTPPAFGAPPQAGGLAPVGAQGTGQPGGETLQVRDSVPQWLLCLFVPLYSAFWYFRVCKELGGWSRGAIHTDPVKSVLAVTLGAMVLIPALISIAGTMGRIRRAQELAGVEPRASFIGFLGRSFLLGYAYKWTQDQLNELATRAPGP